MAITCVKTQNNVRKLSFVLQLSNPDDYEGGNLQLMDEEGESYIAPRKQGTVILFDSRTQSPCAESKERQSVSQSWAGLLVHVGSEVNDD